MVIDSEDRGKDESPTNNKFDERPRNAERFIKTRERAVVAAEHPS